MQQVNVIDSLNKALVNALANAFANALVNAFVNAIAPAESIVIRARATIDRGIA